MGHSKSSAKREVMTNKWYQIDNCSESTWQLFFIINNKAVNVLGVIPKAHVKFANKVSDALQVWSKVSSFRILGLVFIF